MPHHCSILGCTSNSKSSPTFSFHSILFNPDVRRVWIHNIHRDEQKGQWTINTSTCVCSLHFTTDSYHEAGRKKERKTERKNRMLKPCTLLTIFECFSKCLQPTLSKRKTPASHQLLPPKQRDPEDSLGGAAVSHLALMQTFQMMMLCATSIASVYKNCRNP